MSDDFLIKAESVSKKFCRDLETSLKYGIHDLLDELRRKPRRSHELRPDEFWGLKEISFELRKGESLGLIGRNGAGKSTLLQLLNGRMKLDEGRITVRGNPGLVTELGAGFNPVQTGRENIYNSGAVLGMSRRRIDEVFGDIVEFAELEDAMDTPVQNYSSGMRARLGYAVAAHLMPDILMVDEVLAVGDIGFRRKCIQHMIRYLRGGGSLVLVAHDMYALQSICTRCLLLDHGRVLFDGDAVEGLSKYYEMMMHGTRKDAAARLVDAAAPPTPSASPGSSRPSAEQAEDSVPSNFLDALVVRRPHVDPTEANPIVIESLSMRSEDGKGLQTGAGAIVEMRYRSLRDMKGVSWGFTIATGDQLVRIASAFVGLEDRGLPLKSGEGVLSCKIPRLPLLAGTYTLKGGIGERDSKMPIAELGFKTPATVFGVRSSPSVANNVLAMLGVLVTIDVVWNDP